MALIKCKKCGNFISDKAKACPKCGAANLPEGMENPPGAAGPESGKGDGVEGGKDDVQATPKKSRKRLWILPIVIGVVILGGEIGYYLYAEHKAKQEAELLEAARLEQLRLDSIEAARLDSIRQDSIEFRNFTSNDLRVFELHGRVKEVNYESLGEGPLSDLFKTQSFNFDETGILEDKKKKYNYGGVCDERRNELSWRYTKNGYPSKGAYSGNFSDPEYVYISWEYFSEGQLKVCGYGEGPEAYVKEYEYDANGDLVSLTLYGQDNYYASTGIGSVKIEETDKWGNWTIRTITVNYSEETDTELYTDLLTDELPPDPHKGYKLKVNSQGVSVYERKYTKTYTEKRTITYYGAD